MTKQEWKEFHGLCDEVMQRITDGLKVMNGKITAINDKVLDYEKIAYNR